MNKSKIGTDWSHYKADWKKRWWDRGFKRIIQNDEGDIFYIRDSDKEVVNPRTFSYGKMEEDGKVYSWITKKFDLV